MDLPSPSPNAEPDVPSNPIARLVSITTPTVRLPDGGPTPTAEGLMAYCARVSNPANQSNPDYAKLLAYCARMGHWSVFELADMTLEITTSRAVAAQILRHKSFSFQEQSQRYSSTNLSLMSCEARRQDEKNRQNSIDDLPPDTRAWWREVQRLTWQDAERRYEMALEAGIAKECARMILPLGTSTRLYMKGSVRSWIHYLRVRLDPATQLEHRQVAEAARVIFAEQFPITAQALGLG